MTSTKLNGKAALSEEGVVTQTVFVDDFIVMTPYPIQAGHTLLDIKRIKSIDWKPQLRLMAAHIAEGNDAGIIINKPTSIMGYRSTDTPMATKSFKVFLMNSETNLQTLEHRTLRFWFTDKSNDVNNHNTQALKSNYLRISEDFFTNLIGDDFPRNYVSFIMKLMRMLKADYEPIVRMEVELRQLQQGIQQQMVRTDRSLSSDQSLSPTESLDGIAGKESDGHRGSISRPLKDIRSYNIRAQQNGENKPPVIAIITSQHCEKLAVDAMISDKDTYVCYKTEGETSNYVYTLGSVGEMQVVSTKLPAVGNSRNALIAAGNTTTRLLGTFQQLEYIFLVGCSDGLVNYSDYSSNIRLGDIVVSSIPQDLSTASSDEVVWCRPNLKLQQLAKNLWSEGQEDETKRSWVKYTDEGIEILKSQGVQVSRPTTEKCDQSSDNENLRQSMISRALDSEFDAVVKSIYGNRKDNFIFIRGICDYSDGRKREDCQQYSSLVAAAFMKSLICNLSSQK